jgi:hypothetical protein
VLASTVAGTLLLVAVSDPIRGGAALGVAGIAALAAIVATAALLARSLRDGLR